MSTFAFKCAGSKTAEFAAGLIVLLVLLWPGRARAEGEQWLTYRYAHDIQEAYDTVGFPGSQRLALHTDKPEGFIQPDGLPLPQFTGDKQLFARWPSPLSKTGFRFLAFDCSRKNGPYDLLYIDSDGAGGYGRHAAIKATRTSVGAGYSSSSFGPVAMLLAGEDGPVLYQMSIQLGGAPEDVRCYVYATCWYEGQVSIDGRRMRVALIDADANGTFNDASTNPEECDAIRLLGPADGTRSAASSAGADNHSIGKYLQTAGGYLRLEAAQDGAWVKIGPAGEVLMGTIKVDSSMSKVTLVGGNGSFQYEPKAGKAEVPAGTYQVQEWTLALTDGSRARWMLTGGFPMGRGAVPRLWEITAGQQRVVEVGLPLTGKVTMTAQAGRKDKTFNQQILGRQGEAVRMERNGTQPPAPMLRIVNADKTYDKTFKFEYG